MSETVSKRDLRRQMRKLLTAMSASEHQQQASQVWRKVEQLPEFARARHIMLFSALPDELPTDEVIRRWSASRTLYLPRVHGDDIEVVAAEGELSDDNQFHIAEPTGEAVNPDVLDLVIVPGVAFDAEGHRLGRGKGFYDRFLTTLPATTAVVGVAHDCQMLPAIPTEPHDMTIPTIVTPSGVYNNDRNR